MQFITIQSGNKVFVRDLVRKIDYIYPIIDCWDVNLLYEHIKNYFFLDLENIYSGDMRTRTIEWDAIELYMFIIEMEECTEETKKEFFKKDLFKMIGDAIQLLVVVSLNLVSHIKARRRMISKNISVLMYVQYCITQIPFLPLKRPLELPSLVCFPQKKLQTMKEEELV